MWRTWMRAAEVHASTRAFQRHVDSAKWAVEKALRLAMEAGLPERTCFSASAGKDSSVGWHLVAVEMGIPCEAVSEKDDLDFPGEESYLRALEAAWGVPVRIVHPPVSPSAFIEDQARRGSLQPGDDIHARSAGLSKACFYKVIEEATRDYSVHMLGLRAEESGQRAILTQVKGRVYELRGARVKGSDAPRQFRCNPIAGWTGLDVYGYAASRGFDLLHVYRCVGLMHADDPSRVRKSWWLPGASSSRGQVAWLHRYYPSLYERMRGWMPHASMFR